MAPCLEASPQDVYLHASNSEADEGHGEHQSLRRLD